MLRMDALVEAPSLSYPQLFSFQVSYTSRSDHRNSIIPEGSKKGEWRHGILEVDFPIETFFLQDRDRIFLSQTFSSFSKHAEVNSSDDCGLSLIFKSDQWEVATQNSAEKVCLQHLLECIIRGTSIEDAVRIGKDKGIIGLDKSIIKHGRVQRKAVNQKRLEERYLVLVPGKLFVFKNFDIKGKHVRYVTSVLGATVRLLSDEREFQILAPGSKTISLIPESQDDLNSWVESLATSIGHTKQLTTGIESRQKEERKAEVNLCKDDTGVQWTTSSNIHQTTVTNEVTTPRTKQTWQHASEEGTSSHLEAGSDLPLAPKSKTEWDIHDPSQGLQLNTLPSKKVLGQDDKENRERSPCLSKSSTSKQSRAMLYLENALDEMENIVGSIKTTRKLGRSRCFESLDTKKSKHLGASSLRSSWDFDWKAKEEKNWVGKDSYKEKRLREREDTRRHDKMSASDAWKQPLAQIDKIWQSSRNLENKRREFERSLPLPPRQSVDTTRSRDFPGLSKYATLHLDHDQTRRTNSSTDARTNHLLGVSVAAARLSTTTGARSSNVQLSPATQNLLKKYGDDEQLPVTEKNTFGRHGHLGILSTSVTSRDADTRPRVTQQGMIGGGIQPYGETTSSTSEDEEEDEEDDNEHIDEQNQRHFSTPHTESSRGALTEVWGSNAQRDVTCTPHQPVDSCGRPQNQEWQQTLPSSNTQQLSAGYNLANKCDDRSDVLMEATAPMTLEALESQNGPTGVPTKSSPSKQLQVNPSTLQDPIYDPDFSGPQLIKKKQSRMAQNEMTDLRNPQETLHYSSAKVQMTADLSETTLIHDMYRASNNVLPPNAFGEERVSAYNKGLDGCHASIQNGSNFHYLYRKQDVDLPRHSESSGSSVSSQLGQPLPADHGPLFHNNELPELVNRISKITTTFDARDQQQGFNSAKLSLGHGYQTTYVHAQEPVVEPYQRLQKASSFVSTTTNQPQMPNVIQGSRLPSTSSGEAPYMDRHTMKSSLESALTARDRRS